MTYPDTPLGRVEMFVTALEHRGHGKSIVSCRHGHEADCAGQDGEYVPLHAGDLRVLVDQNMTMQRELTAERDRAEAAAAIDDGLDDSKDTDD